VPHGANGIVNQKISSLSQASTNLKSATKTGIVAGLKAAFHFACPVALSSEFSGCVIAKETVLCCGTNERKWQRAFACDILRP
jgi:hypothetical protein